MAKENLTDRTESAPGGSEESQRQEGREGVEEREQEESPVRRAWEKAGEQPDTTPYRESKAVPEPEPMRDTSEG